MGGKPTTAYESGYVTLADRQGHKFSLREVFYVPEAEQPIISFMAAREDGLLLNFTSTHEFEVVAPKTSLRLTGRSVDRILQVSDYNTFPKVYAVSTRSKTHNLNHSNDEDIDIVDVDEDNINSENLREDSIVQTDVKNLPENDGMLAPIQSELPMFPELATTQPSSTSKSLTLNWHRRLGNIAITTLKKLSSIDIDTPSIDCEACIFAKSRKNPFKVRDPSTFVTVKLQ